MIWEPWISLLGSPCYPWAIIQDALYNVMYWSTRPLYWKQQGGRHYYRPQTQLREGWGKVMFYYKWRIWGGPTRCVPPYDPKFSQFHAVFQKFWQNRMLAPPLEGRRPLLQGILDQALITVCHSVHGGGVLSKRVSWRSPHFWSQRGQYGAYWNAFSFLYRLSGGHPRLVY